MEIVISSSNTIGLLSTISHQSTQPIQEKSLQQANAENTTEKPSGNKAPSTKNTAQLSKIPRHMLSTVSHQIITQQAENTTVTQPIIPTALRSKRRNYNRQMRRTLRRILWRILRRNQAATRPPAPRTRLSSPRSHVIYSPRFHIKSSLSKRRQPVTQSSTQSATQLATQSDTLQEEEQEEDLQQANAENTAEKPSGNKATIVKNTAQLSKILRYISHLLNLILYKRRSKRRNYNRQMRRILRRILQRILRRQLLAAVT